jgi:hypothetical protein
MKGTLKITLFYPLSEKFQSHDKFHDLPHQTMFKMVGNGFALHVLTIK